MSDPEKPPYPNRLPKLNPNWLTSTVVGITKGIREAGTWADLPVLADALQDADCDDQDVLTHLRTTHVTTRTPLGDDCTLHTTSETHTCGKFPDRTGGCWEGTCWVIEWLSQEPQRVLASYREAVAGGTRTRLAPVVNPGDMAAFTARWNYYEPRVFLIAPTTWADGPTYAVEARNQTDAEDDFIDSEFGEDHRLTEGELKDYVTDPGEWSESPRPPEYSCQFTGDGNAYDGDQIVTFHVPHLRYHGPGIPHRGVRPLAYAARDDCRVCGEPDCFPMTFRRNDRDRHVPVCGAFCLTEFLDDNPGVKRVPDPEE